MPKAGVTVMPPTLGALLEEGDGPVGVPPPDPPPQPARTNETMINRERTAVNVPRGFI
jgi:hypothetical protein